MSDKNLISRGEPVGGKSIFDNGYKVGYENGHKKVKELEGKLEVAICALHKIWNGTGSNFNAQMCAVETLKQIES